MTQTSLTERYLHAAARTLPETQREEFRRELAERIGDDVDARLAAGATQQDAEHQALVALGEPGALAATYHDRPQHLLGPAHYSTWSNLLRLLLLTVLPFAAFAVALAGVLEGRGPWSVVGFTAVTTLTVGVHVCFWTTLVFVLIERWVPEGELDTWEPEQLPELPEPPRQPWSMAGLLASVTWLALLAVAVAVVDRFGAADGSGGRVPVFQPETWAWLKWLVVGVLVALIAVLVARYVLGRWTWALAGVNAAIAVVFAVPSVLVLANGALVADEFLDRVGWADGPDLWAAGGTLAVIMAFLIGAGAVLGAVDGFRQAHRDGRAGT